MELEAILDGIRKAGKQQIALIGQEADRQSSEIVSKAQSDAEIQERRILTDGKTRLNREQALIEQQALIQALQIHADARQNLIEEVMVKVQDRMPELRDSKHYAKILAKLVDEALKSIEPSTKKGQKIIVHIDPRDKGIAEKVTADFDKPVTVQYDIQCSGGCNAETEDGKVLAMNTLDSRLEHSLPYIKQKLSIFFESKS